MVAERSQPVVRAYIGLGSNLAGPVGQLRRAMDALAALPECHVLACSSLYRSRPLVIDGGEAQADYINAVVCLQTRLSAPALLSALQAIELAQGRRRDGRRWGPRTLDLDILLYGSERYQSEMLTIPHAGLPERDFVLYPLFELESELVVPGLAPVRVLLQACPKRGIVRLDEGLDGQDG